MKNGIPKELTVELAARLVTIKEIVVKVSSELVLSKDGQRNEPQVKTATVTKESDLTPEMIVGGPKAQGEVNGYVLCDGFTAYFNAKTGEAIGRELRLTPPAKPQGRTNTILASPAPRDVNRQYLTK